MSPAQHRFRYNPYGKPSLSLPSGAHSLRFNLSHSRQLALFAFSREMEVGIDVEYVRPDSIVEYITDQIFSPAERAMFRASSENIQSEMFFSCWTHKEAYVKARGEGLSRALNEIDLSQHLKEPITFLNITDDSSNVSTWTIFDLHPDGAYRAALAVEGCCTQIKCWQWLDNDDV
jgi:4'-phosphopantetheinyl transferase